MNPIHISDPAPDIRPGYPSGGERIGPAWQWAWLCLADHEWIKGQDLAQAVAEAKGVSATTVKHLLSQAAKEGILERETRFKGKVGGYKTNTPPIRPAYYRRPW